MAISLWANPHLARYGSANHDRDVRSTCLYYCLYRASDITYYQKKDITSTSFLLTRHYAGVGPFENLPARTVIRASLTSNSSRTAPKLADVSKHSGSIVCLVFDVPVAADFGKELCLHELNVLLGKIPNVLVL
jgi:hypothetical protein